MFEGLFTDQLSSFHLFCCINRYSAGNTADATDQAHLFIPVLQQETRPQR
jgi:hypothetical protein